MMDDDPTVKLRIDGIFPNLEAALRQKIADELFPQDRAVKGNGTDRAVALEVANTQLLRDLSCALTACAISLAATEGSTVAPKTQAKERDVQVPTLSEPSVALAKLFDQRGLSSLTKTLTKLNIGVDRFVEMSGDELASTFQLTFALTKQLQVLQMDIRKRMARDGQRVART
ncbi:MAG: hypothetical protein QXW10_04290 [Candidatus Micrarchaeaceae archaeon]